MSNEKKTGCLGYMVDYTAQLYGYYTIKTRIPIKNNKYFFMEK